MPKQHAYERIGTTLTDYRDGRLCLVYGRPAESLDEVMNQGEWLYEQLLHLHDEYGAAKKMTLLADLKNLDQITLDDRSRALYRKIIELDYLSRVGIVGDAFSFTKVVPLLVMLEKTQKVKFFFNYLEAKDWLGW